MNLFNVCTNVVVVGKINRSSSSSSSSPQRFHLNRKYLCHQEISKFDTLHISFINKRNKTGPKTEPCGTPHLINCMLDA